MSYTPNYNPPLRTGAAAVVSYFGITTPIDTGISVATEAIGAAYGTTGTRTWAGTGIISVQREHLFSPAVYCGTSASQIFTKASTLTILSAPTAGANAIITNAYALWVQAGMAQFDGGVSVTGTLSTASAATALSATFGGSATNGNYITVTGGATAYLGAWKALMGAGNATDSVLLTSGASLGLGVSSGTYLPVTISSTGLAVTGHGTFARAGAATNVTIGEGTAGSSSNLIMRGNATQTAWQISSSTFTSDTLEFTPSTAGGGTTFTTPVMKLNTTGLAVTGTLSATGMVKYNGSGAGELQFNSTNAASQTHTISSYYNTGAAFAPLNISAGTITIYVGGSATSTISSTGLAVTGIGTFTHGSAGNVTIASSGIGTAALQYSTNATNRWSNYVPSGATNLVWSTSTTLDGSTGKVLDLSSTGLAVTGTLSATGVISSTAGGKQFELTGQSGSPAYITVDQTANSGKLWRVGNTGAVSYNTFDIYDQTDSITVASCASTGLTVNASGSAMVNPLTVIGDGSTYTATIAIQRNNSTSASGRLDMIGNTGTVGARWSFNDAVASAWEAQISGSTYFTVKSGASGIRFNGYGAGTLSTDASGNITASSDASLKTNLRAFTKGLAAICAITPKTFNWTAESGLDTEHDYTGLIAQDVQAAIPEAVYGDNTLTLNDRTLIAALINAAKELKQQNDDLRARVAQLESQ